MNFLALGGAILLLCLWGYRRSPGAQRGRWRVGSGLLALALIAGAGIVAVRGAWLEAAIMGGAGAALAYAARSRRGPRPQDAVRSSAMTLAEARAILGVEDSASQEEIQGAYTRLMRRAHPDLGGTSGLAAQINAARDLLLARR